MDPRQFLSTIVEPNITELSTNGGDVRRAYNAVFAVDALAAHLYSWAKSHAPTHVHAYSDDTRFREALAQRNTEFQLVRDLAKALKHVELLRGNPQVKGASQMGAETLGFDVGRFDEARYDAPAQIVVTTDLGEKRVVEAVLQNSLKFLNAEMRGSGCEHDAAAQGGQGSRPAGNSSAAPFPIMSFAARRVRGGGVLGARTVRHGGPCVGIN
jgi:hypothetical protein